MSDTTKPQVAKPYYDFLAYNDPERWASYWHQLEETLAFKPKRVLEIGAGSGIIGPILMREGVEYKTLDIAADLKPDFVGSVDAIPAPDENFDLACAFEILEHLPFEKFETAIREIHRVSKMGAVISLPHFGPPIKFLIKLPFLPEIRFAWKVPYPRTHVFNGQHYWEIGKRGYSPARIRAVLEKYFTITKEFVPFSNQYHHFFVLVKK